MNYKNFKSYPKEIKPIYANYKKVEFIDVINYYENEFEKILGKKCKIELKDLTTKSELLDVFYYDLNVQINIHSDNLLISFCNMKGLPGQCSTMICSNVNVHYDAYKRKGVSSLLQHFIEDFCKYTKYTFILQTTNNEKDNLNYNELLEKANYKEIFSGKSNRTNNKIKYYIKELK